LDNYTRGQVNALQLYQFDQLTQNLANPVRPSQMAGFYLGRFASDDREEDAILGIFSPKGGHAVVPYRLTNRGSGIYDLHVYDPNFSRSNDRVLTIDTVNETYGYASGPNVYTGPPAILFGDNPTIDRVAVPEFRYYPRPLADDAPPEQGGAGLFARPRAAAYTLTASDGSTIRYADTTATVGIDGAEARYELTGYPTAPHGYRLPTDAYTLAFDDTAPGDGVLIRRGNEYLGFAVSDEDDGGQARQQAGAFIVDLNAAGRLAVQASDEQTGVSVRLESLALMAEDVERSFRLDNLLLPGGTTVSTTLSPDSSALRIEAPATATTYRLVLTHSKPGASGFFLYDEVTLDGGAIHTVRPPWGRLATAPVLVEVDRDGNGTIDETRELANQVAVDREQDDPTALLPAVFALSVYPNPTATAATVEIALPEAAEVKAGVFDLLGRRVAVLHDGTLAAGAHALRFDAARLPSGLYVVHATTPEATLTQRLTLVR
ncbi:MAG: T9SS type A sorting domain-containing protein, partial [Bacteroidota bacterium]